MASFRLFSRTARVISLPLWSSHSVLFLFCFCFVFANCYDRACLGKYFFFQYTDNQTINGAHQSFFGRCYHRRIYCSCDRIVAHLLTSSFSTHLCYSYKNTQTYLRDKNVCARFIPKLVPFHDDLPPIRSISMWHVEDFSWHTDIFVHSFILIACVNVNL